MIKIEVNLGTLVQIANRTPNPEYAISLVEGTPYPKPTPEPRVVTLEEGKEKFQTQADFRSWDPWARTVEVSHKVIHYANEHGETQHWRNTDKGYTTRVLSEQARKHTMTLEEWNALPKVVV
jgi:hypothetical protein